MGRILRKKASQKIKKKKGVDEGTTSQANTENTAEQAVPAVVSDKDAAKRQVVPQKKSLPAVKPSQGGAVKNFMERSVQFLREVKVELKKVTWPSRKQTMGSTLVVLILVIIISLFLGVVDIGLSSLIRLVFK
ncbi:MAG: preprotein translocase subunit SecE [Thermodesulfobacteriota bacterium]